MDQSSSSYPRLVGDVGGTNARFGLVPAPGAAPESIDVLAAAAYPSLEAAIRHYLHTCKPPAAPRWAALGIANPLHGDAVRMTNHHWSFSARELARQLDLDRLLLVNDFTALALSLPGLGADGYRQVGGGTADPQGTIGLIGAGTGLGVSGLVPDGNGYIPLAGEGGHVTLAAYGREEAEVVAWFAERHGHVSAERVLSGAGLAALRQALAQLRGEADAAAAALSPATVTARALEGSDPLCVDAVGMFCAMLGTVAGNLALTLGASGGIYIGGGIVPKLGEFFDRSPFRARFEDKGRFGDYLARIPTCVLTAPYGAMLGANRALERTRLAGSVDVRRA
jgi:glucokinase